MPLRRVAKDNEKAKRGTGSIDKIRINDDRVQILTGEGKIYVFDKRDICPVTNISLRVNNRQVNISFENSGYGSSTNALRFHRYPIVEFGNLTPNAIKTYMKSILRESILDLSDVKVIHSYKRGGNEPYIYILDSETLLDDERIYAKLSNDDIDRNVSECGEKKTNSGNVTESDDFSDDEEYFEYVEDGYEDNLFEEDDWE